MHALRNSPITRKQTLINNTLNSKTRCKTTFKIFLLSFDKQNIVENFAIYIVRVVKVAIWRSGLERQVIQLERSACSRATLNRFSFCRNLYDKSVGARGFA